MKKSKKFLSVALVAVLLFSMCTLLAGCGSTDGSAGDEYTYVPQYITVTGDRPDYMSNVTFANDMFYFYSNVTEEVDMTVEEFKALGGRTYDDVTPTDLSFATAKTDAVAPIAVATGTDIATSSDISNMYVMDGKVYAYWNYFFSMDLEGKSTKLFKYIPAAIPEDMDGSSYLSSVSVDDAGNIWALEQQSLFTYNLPAGMTRDDPEAWQYQTFLGDNYTLVRFAPDGTVVSRSELSDVLGESSYVSGMVCDGDGNIALSSQGMAVVISPEGDILYKYETDNWFNGVFRMADGRVGILESGESNNVVVLDNEAETGVTLCSVPSTVYNITPGGGGDYDFYYTNGAFLYGINIEDAAPSESAAPSEGAAPAAEPVKVLSWINCDINDTNLNSTVILPDGRIAATTYNWDSTAEQGVNELVLLTKTLVTPENRREILTLAVQRLGYEQRDQIINFNKTNTEYRVEVLDYSEYNTDDDYEAGLKKLRTEILSGQVPDIIDLTGLNASQLAGLGYLADLGEFLDNDPELSRDDIMDNVLAAISDDEGHIYQTCTTFTILTCGGLASVVGTEPGWTAQELLDIYNAMPDGTTIFDDSTTQTDILGLMLALELESFVDWETGECNFDSEGFIGLLEFVDLFPSEFDWENYDWENYTSSESRILSGKQLLLGTSIYDFWDFQYNDAMYGGNLVFKGFPTEQGVGNFLRLDNSAGSYAISTTCKNADVAWQFVRQSFTEEGAAMGYGFPSNKHAFAENLEDAMTPTWQTDQYGDYVLDEDGNKIEQSNGGASLEGGEYVEFYSMTQDQADRLVALINSTTRVMNEDQDIVDLVTEEAADFFSGAKSAAEVAKLVQSRVSLAVSERS